MVEKEVPDPTDGFGTDLRISLRENQILLVEPNDPNVPWITDRARLFFDGMFTKVKNKNILWNSFFNNFFYILYFIDLCNFQKKKFFFLTFVFENISFEVLNILYLLQQLNSLLVIKKLEEEKFSENDLELNFQLNNSIKKPKLISSTIALLLNVNPRNEGYALNLSLRERFFRGNFKVLSIGPLLNLTFPMLNLGSNFNVFKTIIEGAHFVCQDLTNKNNPFLVSNTEFFKKNDSNVLYNNLQKINILNQLPINVLNPSLNNVNINTLYKFPSLSIKDFESSFGFYFVNVLTQSSSNFKRFIKMYLLKISNYFNQNLQTIIPKIIVDQSVDFNNNKKFFVEFKNKFFNNYFYLPNSLFLEEPETFINTQGIIKRSAKLLSFKKFAKSNWQILRKLYLKITSMKFFSQIKDFEIIKFEVINSFNYKNYLVYCFLTTQTFTAFSFYLIKQNSPHFNLKPKLNVKFLKTKMCYTKLKNWLDDFFIKDKKDFFSYNSSVLINCSKILRNSLTNFF